MDKELSRYEILWNIISETNQYDYTEEIILNAMQQYADQQVKKRAVAFAFWVCQGHLSIFKIEQLYESEEFKKYWEQQKTIMKATQIEQGNKLSPMQAIGEDAHIKLEADNFSTKDYWILTDGVNVHLCKQREGKPAQETMYMPVNDFNKLINWYIKEQNVQVSDTKQ